MEKTIFPTEWIKKGKLKDSKKNNIERAKKKEYTVCVGSHESNNSDYKEYNNYTTKANSWEEAYEYAKRCIANWNKESKDGIVYSIDHVTPHN